jgi:hypothetical protein
MTTAATTSMTKNAAPTDAPTITAVASKFPSIADATGTQAAAAVLPKDNVV